MYSKKQYIECTGFVLSVVSASAGGLGKHPQQKRGDHYICKYCFKLLFWGAVMGAFRRFCGTSWAMAEGTECPVLCSELTRGSAVRSAHQQPLACPCGYGDPSATQPRRLSSSPRLLAAPFLHTMLRLQ